MNYSYYYNNTPDNGLVRNNLIYTSLISDDKKVFVQWYHNDTKYHKGKNQVVDPTLMDEKWQREVKYLTVMKENFPHLVPNILDINENDRKIYLEIAGPDFWEVSGCLSENYNSTLLDWQDQMLEILRAHKELGFYKYSLHPSSYFIVNGQLKSINYFFCASEDEDKVPLRVYKSHISEFRQKKLEVFLEQKGISWDSIVPYKTLQLIALDSFLFNFPLDFIEKAKDLYR